MVRHVILHDSVGLKLSIEARGSSKRIGGASGSAASLSFYSLAMLEWNRLTDVVDDLRHLNLVFSVAFLARLLQQPVFNLSGFRTRSLLFVEYVRVLHVLDGLEASQQSNSTVIAHVNSAELKEQLFKASDYNDETRVAEGEALLLVDILDVLQRQD